MRSKRPAGKDPKLAAERLLKVRPRSVGELRERLARKGFLREDIEGVIDRLQQKGVLDDRAFARWWIGQRAVLKPKGAFGLLMELRAKRVDRETIQQALAETGVPEAEFELAQEALKPRLARLARLDPLRGKRKVHDFLARRGFSRDVISEIIRSLEDK